MGGDSRFWVSFGIIWLIVGLSFVVGTLGVYLFVDPAEINEPDTLWVFLALGLAVTAVGSFIVRRARLTAARDKRLMDSGMQVTATIKDVRRSPIDINRQARWHIHYRYEYGAGQTYDGRSRALSSAEVEGVRPGDRVLVMADPRQPAESLFVRAQI